MVQRNNPNIESDRPEMTPEFVRDLLVSAMVMWFCVRRGPAADLRNEMEDCVKDAHARMGGMLAKFRAFRKQ